MDAFVIDLWIVNTGYVVDVITCKLVFEWCIQVRCCTIGAISRRDQRNDIIRVCKLSEQQHACTNEQIQISFKCRRTNTRSRNSNALDCDFDSACAAHVRELDGKQYGQSRTSRVTSNANRASIKFLEIVGHPMKDLWRKLLEGGGKAPMNINVLEKLFFVEPLLEQLIHRIQEFCSPFHHILKCCRGRKRSCNEDRANAGRNAGSECTRNT
mmetsp:Transcript_95164/g.183498  ORF Transcript_95164/g.183498 Transcript_95164/m.183498 type:complete len:212 (+) Transcript_95164:1634-2269(+)